MISPGSNAFLVSAAILLAALYLLIFQRRVVSKLGSAFRFVLYFGLVFGGLVFIWGIVYLVHNLTSK